MKKLLIVCSLVLSFITTAVGGTTAVTATITDPSTQVFANGTVRADFRPTPGVPGPFTVNGIPFTQSVSTTLNASGLFTMTLTDSLTINPSGSMWDFTICSNTSAPCFKATTVVTGASQNLSATLSTSAPLIRIFTAPTINRAYSDTEVTGGTGSIYWNVLSSALKCYDGSAWIGCQSNSTFSDLITAGPWLDVRSLSGVDCTGILPSDVALNALTTVNYAINGKALMFPPGCIIKLNNTWTIKNQSAFKLGTWAGAGANGGSGSNSPTIGWCGAAGDLPMVDMEYVDGFEVTGIAFTAKITGCANFAGTNVIVDKTGAGGLINTTDGLFKRDYFTTNLNGAAHANWVGLSISPVSISNVEDIRVEDSSFYGNISTTSACIKIGNSANAKNELIRHNNIHECTYGVWQLSGQSIIKENELGSTTVALEIDKWTDVQIIEDNLDEDSKQFFVTLYGANNPIIFKGNHPAGDGADVTKFHYDLGADATGSLSATFDSNGTDLYPANTKWIGASAASPLNMHIVTRNNLWPTGSPIGLDPFWTKFQYAFMSEYRFNYLNDQTLVPYRSVGGFKVENTAGTQKALIDSNGDSTFHDITVNTCTGCAAGTGTVTSVATTAPITGGTFTVSGTIACATCVTSAAALTSNAVVIGGGGQAASTISANTTTTNALFATAGAPAFRQPVAADIAAGALANGMTATTQSAADNSTKLATTAYADTVAHTMAGAGTKTCTNQAVTVLTTNANSAPTGTCSTITSAYVDTTVTKNIASGAKALATGAISSAACTSAQTDTATGTLTTDTIIVSFNGDPTAVTGYVPLTTGMLTIIPYPTADTVNFKVCNNTGASITPGAITLNWKVVR